MLLENTGRTGCSPGHTLSGGHIRTCLVLALGYNKMAGTDALPEGAGGSQRENLESSQPGKPRSESGKKDHILAQAFSVSTCFSFWTVIQSQQWHPIRFAVVQ